MDEYKIGSLTPDNNNYSSQFQMNNYRSSKNTNSLYNSQVTFDNELNVIKNNKRELKDDLDFMLKLKQAKQNEEKMEKLREREEFNKRVEYLNQVAQRNKIDQQKLSHIHHEQLASEARMQKERERQKQETDLQQHLKFLNYVEFQKMAETRQRQQQKENLKLLHRNYFETFMDKKKIEELKRQEDQRQELEYMKIRNAEQERRDKEYKDKLNRLNKNIFDHGQSTASFLERQNSPIVPKDVYNVNNDKEYNTKIVLEHQIEQSLNKKQEQNLLEERLKNLDEYNRYVRDSKLNKLEEQKKYKEYLDSQVEKNISDGKKQMFIYNKHNDFILPGYDHPNRPIPTYKKAIDHISRLRHSYDFKDSSNALNLNSILSSPERKKEINQEGSYVKNNPLTMPYSSLKYNKYIDREFNKMQMQYDNGRIV